MREESGKEGLVQDAVDQEEGQPPHDGAVGKEDFLDGDHHQIVKHFLFSPSCHQL